MPARTGAPRGRRWTTGCRDGWTGYATPQTPAPSPLLNIILVIAAIGVLAGGGFMVRRSLRNTNVFLSYS
jgi:hypothetical protein